jgi:ABC-type multidrug transport system fused ATPase/permease subunit
MHIKPGEKIGICGRTGSGKTSLMLLLFSMIELSNGSVSIDGIDLSTLQKDDLRSRLNGVPDDPFFFPGSIRANIDIEGSATDEQLRLALAQLGLGEALSCVQGGLDAEFKPEELSQGQKQKLALARAMLRPCGKVVILDEATSKQVLMSS